MPRTPAIRRPRARVTSNATVHATGHGTRHAARYASAQQAHVAIAKLVSKLEVAGAAASANASFEPLVTSLLDSDEEDRFLRDARRRALLDALGETMSRMQGEAIARFKAVGNEVVKRIWSDDHPGDPAPDELLFAGEDPSAAADARSYDDGELLRAVRAAFDPKRWSARHVQEVLEEAVERAYGKRIAN